MIQSQKTKMWKLMMILMLMFVQICQPTCVKTNYYKTLASATFKSAQKSPTGNDYTIVAANESGK
jgi:hypothetical protein